MTDLTVQAPGRSDPLERQALTTMPQDIVDMEPWAPHSTYTVEDAVHAFAVLYLHGGNFKRAERVLREQGGRTGKITRNTLQGWVTRYPGRYAHVGRIFRDVAEEQIIVALRENTLAAIHASTRAVELELERIEKGDIKDAGAAAQRLMVTAGVATDKVLSLTGRPQQIVQHQSGKEILRTLAQFGQAQIAEAPVVDAEVVEESG